MPPAAVLAWLLGRDSAIGQNLAINRVSLVLWRSGRFTTKFHLRQRWNGGFQFRWKCWLSIRCFPYPHRETAFSG